MALKKSQLYSSLWSSCDELRGGMDASQYKDYVLTLLFMKYVSDKYAGKPDALIEVPPGGSFQDMAALRGDKEIGDKINKIIARFAAANELRNVIDQADFNDESKLGSGKDMQDRLSRLVAIFDGLDFRASRAEGDDLLGDAYEVSFQIILYGQEKDIATRGHAIMNAFLHDHPTAETRQGNTVTDPEFKDDGGNLNRIDYVVANPPYFDKAKAALKAVRNQLNEAVARKYGELTEPDVISLVVHDKWLACIESEVESEVERISQGLAGRVQTLVQRYQQPLPSIVEGVEALAARVDGHLRPMGFAT